MARTRIWGFLALYQNNSSLTHSLTHSSYSPCFQMQCYNFLLTILRNSPSNSPTDQHWPQVHTHTHTHTHTCGVCILADVCKVLCVYLCVCHMWCVQVSSLFEVTSEMLREIHHKWRVRPKHFLPAIHPPSPPLSLSHSLTLPLSLSLTHTHTHTLSLSLPLSLSAQCKRVRDYFMKRPKEKKKMIEKVLASDLFRGNKSLYKQTYTHSLTHSLTHSSLTNSLTLTHHSLTHNYASNFRVSEPFQSDHLALRSDQRWSKIVAETNEQRIIWCDRAHKINRRDGKVRPTHTHTHTHTHTSLRGVLNL